jgi:hypothetical protein
MSFSAVSRLVSVFLLTAGSCVALANTVGDVRPSLRAVIEKATYRIEPEPKSGANTGYVATGRSLPSRMELRGRELALLVDDTAAVYPVTVDSLLTRETKLTASDAAAGDQFGASVAISKDTAVVGASTKSGADYFSGSAYVFVRSGGVWNQQQKLTASDAATGAYFGSSVAVSGDTALVGSPFASASGYRSGAVYVFERSGGVWRQLQKLAPGTGAGLDYFGGSVAVSGDTAVVGAMGDSGALFHSGAAYLFVRSGGVWSLRQKLTANESFRLGVCFCAERSRLDPAAETDGERRRDIRLLRSLRGHQRELDGDRFPS